MPTEFTLNLATVYKFLLVLARVAGLIAIVPIPGLAAVPDSSRVVLAVVLTVALLPAGSVPATSTPSPGELAGWILREAAFGLTIGVAIAFLLEGIQLAAQMIGLYDAAVAAKLEAYKRKLADGVEAKSRKLKESHQL